MQAENISTLHALEKTEICTGQILGVDDQVYQILGSEGEYSATRAFSCIVQPQQGDKVLFSVNSVRQCHILSIIERPDSNDTRLMFPGDVVLSASKGQLKINGKQGVTINSERCISQTSEEYNLIADKAIFGIDSLTAIGSRLVTKITDLQTYAGTIETVAGNLLQKVKNSVRLIEGVDQSRSRDAIHTVKNLFSLRSNQAAIVAKKDIKVDAERIHMG